MQSSTQSALRKQELTTITLLLLFLISGLFVPRAFGQITTEFTGTIAFGTVGNGAGFFSTPAQTVVSGQFTINPSNLGTPFQGTDSNGNYTEWTNGGLGTLTNPNTDSISVSSSSGSLVVPNLVALDLDGGFTIVDYQTYSGSPAYSAQFLLHCNNPILGNTLATAFPLSVPQYCAAQIDFYDAAGDQITVLISNLIDIQPSPIQMLDPTPLALTDPTQSLMNGNQVTSDQAKLDTLGRAVQGIAADGTAEIVLRIPTNSVGDVVTATVLSDTCTNSADPSTCAVSTSAAFDGGLVALGNAANPAQAAATAPVTAADSNKFANVIYRAPVDFVRLGNSVDQLLNTRSIQFKLTYQTSQGASYGTQYVPLTIVRPPVVLTHGYASNAIDTWGNFGSVSSHTVVYRIDYGSPIQLFSTSPAIACLPTCVTLVSKSDLGITYNTPDVANQTVIRLRDYALGHNTVNGPIAVSQVDSIGHSMGGVIQRYWSTNTATNLDGTAVPFNAPNNFGQGYIHKLITIATPHYGSPLATESLSTGQSGSGNGRGAECFRNISAEEIRNPESGKVIKPARYQIGTALLDSAGTSVGGAIGDLDGDGIGLRLSAALSKIMTNAAHLPTFTIAGTATPAAFGGYDLVNAICGLLQDPVADRMTIQLYGTLFDPSLTPATDLNQGMSTVNDGAVPLTSALHGQSCNGPGAQCFANDAHGGGTALLLGASTNLVEDNNVLLLVQQLLNTSVADTKWVVQ